MKQNYLYIFIIILLFTLFIYLYLNTFYESFEQRKQQTIVLMGDSILKNDSYVSDGMSVEDLLREKNKKVLCLAVDDSKIIDVYEQLFKIPINLNNNNTTIFLSIGGNDILSQYVRNDTDITNTDALMTIFIAYKKLIKSIQTKLPNANLILMDIYYPNNLIYKQYHNIISEWNNLLYNYSNELKNNIYTVLKISSIVTQPEDFTFGIEPSSSGSKKIVDLILEVN